MSSAREIAKIKVKQEVISFKDGEDLEKTSQTFHPYSMNSLPDQVLLDVKNHQNTTYAARIF